MSDNKEYGADQINVLEGLSAIRKRPGMYIGDVNVRGLHHCVFEVLDNSIDEAVAGFGKKIILTKLNNGGIKVEDFGRGIPVDKKANGISAATITLTVLHAGGKFDKDSYKTSGGLHGIGIKATNATSKWLKLTVCRNGEKWEQEFEKGKPLYDIKKVGESKKNGTTLEFIPDDTLFDTVDYDVEILKTRLRTSSYLTKGVELTYINEETKEKEVFLSTKGLEDMVSHYVHQEDVLSPVMSYEGSDEKRGLVIDSESGKREENGILEKFDIEVSFLYEKGYKTTMKSFVNKILTPGGGVHEQGVLDALSSSILKKVREAKVQSKRDKEILKKVNIDDIREGLFLAVSLSVYTEIVFEGQTKEKLSGKYLRTMIRELSKTKVEQYLEENPAISAQIVQKVITARKARESADRARKAERKKTSDEIGGMLGKLSDCRSNNPEECELFIVEGDGAGGSSKQGRDGRVQAILPLKGKPINVLKNDLKKVFANDEIKSLSTALGCGMGANLDISKLRYHKIINQMDADIDGCLRGDSKIKLLDGSIKTIKELSYLYPIGGDSFEVWSYDIKQNKPVVGLAHSVRVTKRVNKLYRITFDNDSIIECTDNHPFLDIYGDYHRADSLKVGQNIESLYFNNSKGYDFLSGKTIKYSPVHRYIQSLRNNINGLDVHHIDENKINNKSSNLETLTRNEHSKIHSKKGKNNLIDYNKSQKHLDDITLAKEKGSYKNNKFFDTYNKTKEHSQVVSKRNKEIWKDDEYRKHMKNKQTEYLENGGKEVLSSNTKSQWEDSDISFKMQATRMVNVIKKCISEKGSVNKENYNLLKPKSGVPTWDTMLLKLDLRESEVHDYANSYNHIITNIEVFDVNDEEVYDMTVDKYNNFGVIVDDLDTEIVFVHNSHIQQLLLTVFNTLFKELLTQGFIYNAVPPLHRVKVGQAVTYLNSEADKTTYIKKTKSASLKTIKASKAYKDLYLNDKEFIFDRQDAIKDLNKELLELNKSESKDTKLISTLLNEITLKEHEIELTKSDIYLKAELKKLMGKHVFNRFKGLGEMNPEQLAETTMAPETRTIIRLFPDPVYDVSDELDIQGMFDTEDEALTDDILAIISRRIAEIPAEGIERPKDCLIDINSDTLINLVSSDEGKEFRRVYLMRNIILEKGE